MSKVAEKAARAERLRADESYQEFIGEVRNAQSAVFLNAHSTAEEREAAHAIVRALTKIEDALATAIGGWTFEQAKKGQHRGSD